jgi:hypothetical protein
LSDEGDEDEDDTDRLSELIILAEVGLQVVEDKDNTDRLSELIALAEAGLQAKEDEDDTGGLSELIALAEVDLQAEEDDNAFFTQAATAADEAEAAYYRRQAGQSNVGEPSHSNRVVVEDWYLDDELLTQYVSA